MELNLKNNKPIIFSGVQPSGVLHLGNYLGALTQWVEMQNQSNCIFCVVDYHAITVKQEPKELSRRILDVVKAYLASGINPEKVVIFQQSDITAHTELAWILNCIARVADLNKMTQFKEKACLPDRQGGSKESVSVGLFDYPVLMAADILLYNTDSVPVGDDQVQHVELTRTLAQRFNREYGQVFKIPEVAVRKQGARIMGLDDPTKKMSKSASSPANYIALTDAPEIAAKKIMRAVTDSSSKIKYDLKKKPAISNLMTIYSLLSGVSVKKLEKDYQGKGYGDFKKDLAETVKSFLAEH
ncbi:tryptophan--tRNA ligase [Candidatus Falkowbacteria bacterium]|nr:tryptophan--tRNA ligase [Candidatus Falkowbacteria bacterium]